jgi:O-acetyl-ADP-ribose deacetylase (regulator of RNase III)
MGDLLSADVEALVNTVNTVGVMGKGLALQFKRRFPANFAIYAAACQRGEVEVGRMLIVETARTTTPRFIINFPTKKHWRDPSRLEYVRAGLVALVCEIRERGIRSIAIPPLGCGNGGLTWAAVRPLIDQALEKLTGVRALVFAPDAGLERQVSTTQLGLPLED